jgi:hypothetical protein
VADRAAPIDLAGARAERDFLASVRAMGERRTAQSFGLALRGALGPELLEYVNTLSPAEQRQLAAACRRCVEGFRRLRG